MIQTIVLTIALIGVILLIEPKDMSNPRAVSYTHLTLPTICSV